MAGEDLVKVLQIAGAALGIPAPPPAPLPLTKLFLNRRTCQKLRTNIVATMERSVAPETKRTLLRKDVNEFDKLCGDGDPDARTIFHAAVTPNPRLWLPRPQRDDCRCRPWHGCGRRAAGSGIPPLAAPVGGPCSVLPAY
jgi:hypothetical protein